MRGLTLVSLAALAFMAPASAQNSPYSEPAAPRSGGYADPSVPSLGDVMLSAQLRHIKVWFAGRTGSWALLKHEAVRLQDTLIRAAMLYHGIPIEEVAKINDPIAAIIQAAEDRNISKFQAAYADLTSACNSCHKSGGVEFIRVQTPSASPFSDQGYPGLP
ncbi:hypothetical protein GCM10007036_08200 [Alsobacter metallidurans]|uniref:Cytochrome c domain-containing protein n=1 Tax=Alsobacter metallidurans TaxID=340221 RepID=A0A917I3P0_9HYPH|nr:hypothetical protein [Alsobacter metallidurans]GGH11269.1 hypothetical protein GCM10007036_08200 [Alsobacter metallidurans]